jgi:hypothetical protein
MFMPDSGSEFSIQISGQKGTGSRIRIRGKEFKHFFNPKNVNYDPDCFIPDPRSRGLKSTGSRILNTPGPPVNWKSEWIFMSHL